MDPVSQAVLGAACAESTARRQQMLAAAICGLVAGMAADLDILIRSDTDPLLGIEFHRHFTHSLLFAPFGALVIILLLYPVMRRWLGFGVGYGFCCLGRDRCVPHQRLLDFGKPTHKARRGPPRNAIGEQKIQCLIICQAGNSASQCHGVVAFLRLLA